MTEKKLTFKEVPVELLRWHCDPATLGFKTTNDLEEHPDIIGQRRAVNALKLGLDIDSQGYNLFANGQPGTGRKTAVKALLKETARYKRIPEDKIFVNNFKNTDEPILIRLKAGDGRKFKKDMQTFIDYMLTHVPEIFESEAYQEQRKEKMESVKTKQRELIKTFEDKASEEDFAIIQMQIGSVMRPAVLPVVDGKAVNFEHLKGMEKEGKMTKKEIDEKDEVHSRLMDQLEEVFDQIRVMDNEMEEQLKEMDSAVINPLVAEKINETRSRYPCESVNAYLDEVMESIQEHPLQFMPPDDEDAKKKPPKDPDEPGDPFLEYRVNLLVDNHEADKAPVIFETSPSYTNLFGTVEVTPERHGGARTDFTKIKAGSFLKADGGFLIVEALDLLTEPGVWTAFKRTLKNRQVEIQIYAPVFMVSISAMKPKPIGCDVKVAIVGSPELYQLLYYQDPDFKKIFKLRADFDSVMDIETDSIMDYANFTRRIVSWEKLLPFNSKAVAAVIEHGVRMAGRQGKLSTQFNQVADLLREADYWARKDKRRVVSDKYIRKAIDEKNDRSALVEERMREMIEEGTILIDARGSAVGQVNGLSVYDMGDYAFGKPARITANVSVGDAGIINIEREAHMSGRLHNKGVLILAGYLRAKFAQNKPLAMAASLCFEQSYGGVDGDSASSTEIYALLSALSGLPLKQDIAVTGSVNQKGEIQPIGGVNEKIEGFFDVCRIHGLTGTQGVMIPHQNMVDLMLKEEVVKAVKRGKFRIYPVKNIEQGIEILTNVPAGKMKKNKAYPGGTVFQLVDARLSEFAETWKNFKS